jgi:hypothetical protein
MVRRALMGDPTMHRLARILTPVALVAATPYVAPQPVTGKSAVVPGFTADGFVQKRINGADGVFVQALSGKWYYLKAQGACPRLAEEDTVGIQTSANGQLDRYAQLMVQGRRCLVASVMEVAPPPPGHRS